jgi:hypothetical protein
MVLAFLVYPAMPARAGIYDRGKIIIPVRLVATDGAEMPGSSPGMTSCLRHIHI